MGLMAKKENSEEKELTPLMEQYGKETGKNARGKDGELTKDYKKWRRERRKEGKKNPLTSFFSKVGGAVISTGESTAKAPSKIKSAVKRKPTPEKKERKLSERLQDLKRLETRREEVREEMPSRWEELEEIGEARKAELARPLSERLADSFYKPLKAPAARMTGFFTGLEEDLFKAGMRIPVERYVALMLGVGIIVGIGGFFLSWLFLGFLLAIPVGLMSFMIALLLARRRPILRIQGRKNEIDQTLPYALRHISTQLSSGIGLAESMTSVSQADYGALSEEFERVLRDMRAGASMADALTRMTERVDSEPLNRAVRQIQRTMKTGGNLSSTLSMMADETAFDMRMKLRDYTQSLNMMSMIYMFASAVIPALFIVLLIVMQFMGGASMPISLIAIIYLVALPFLLFYLVMIFKRMEPGV